MPTVYADLQLANGLDEDARVIAVHVRVDADQRHLLLPAHLAAALGVAVRDRRTVRTSTGEARAVDYVGPVRVTFGDRGCWMGALVDGNELVVGTMAVDSMDLVIDPALQALTVNPSSPNIARSFAVGVRTANP